MRVVPLADVKNRFRENLERAKKEPVFITRNGRIVAVLERITDDEVEDFLLERSPKFRKMLNEAGKRRGGMSLERYRKSRGV